MKLSEVKLCPTCVAKSGGRFGAMVDEGQPGGFRIVVFARNAYLETPTKAGVYHVRTTKRPKILNRFGGEENHNVQERAGLLCRGDGDPVEWRGAALDARFQLWLSMAVEAVESWGDDLGPAALDIHTAELEAAGERCEELATAALHAVARGDLGQAAERLAQAAQLEVLDCGRSGGYARLHAEVRRAALAEKGAHDAQEA